MTILNARCSSCNRVSSALIETELGDFTKKRFFRDDEHQDVLCEECKEVHEELMLDYENKDDPWRHYENDNDPEVPTLLEEIWKSTPDEYAFESEEEA
jgi:hypothetical protein